MKPRHLTDADIDALLAEMEQELKASKADLKTARRLANDFAPDGHKSSTGADDSPRGSEVSRPTEVMALRLVERGADPTQGYRSTLRNRVANLRSALADLSQTRGSIMSRADDPDLEGDHRRPALGAGHCRACDRDCSGVENDRLRGGLCGACRTQFERNSAKWDHDRVWFARWKRAEPAEHTERG